MTDSVLDLLKWTLLGLLYLFFARVLWAVWTEVRSAAHTPQTSPAGGAPAAASARSAAEPDTTHAIASDPTESSRRPGRTRRSASTPRRGTASTLVVLEPKSLKGTSLQIADGITFGREATCTLSLPDDTYVSGLHARVSLSEGQPMIEDLGSTNGSFHNGNRFSGLKLLHPGDRLQIGQTVIEVR